MARKAKANSGGLWLITGSCPLCPLLGEVIAITKVGYRSPAESPRAAKQAQVKHLHSTHRTDQMWFSNSLDLQALEKAQVWLLFNSQTNSCGMLQLLVTIPLPVWDFDFIFRHVKLGGWLSLEQLVCGGEVGWGLARENSLQHIVFGSEISRNQTLYVDLFVLPELFSHCGRFPVPEIGSLLVCWSGSFCPLKHKCLGIIFCNSLMLE